MNFYPTMFTTYLKIILKSEVQSAFSTFVTHHRTKLWVISNFYRLPPFFLCNLMLSSLSYSVPFPCFFHFTRVLSHFFYNISLVFPLYIGFSADFVTLSSYVLKSSVFVPVMFYTPFLIFCATIIAFILMYVAFSFSLFYFILNILIYLQICLLLY